MSEAKKIYQKYCSVIGAHLIMAPASFMWFYGNLFAYLDSYFRFSCYPTCLDCDPEWLLPVYVTGMFPGFFMVKPLEKLFGLKWTGTIAMVMGSAALLGSAWSLQRSVAWTAVLYAILLGTGHGMTASVSIQVISGWAPERVSFLLATSTGTATMLSVPFNQIITVFINPQNLKPDAKIGPKAYFSQPELLGSIPRAVIILGLVTFGLQTAGCILLINPPDNPSDPPEKATKEDGISRKTKTSNVNEGIPFECANDLNNVENYQALKYSGSNAQSSKLMDLEEISLYNGFRTNNLRSYTPKEVLRSPVFYAVFLFGMALEYTLLLKSNFYKKFALLYISDDKYLTLIGSLIPVISTCSRILFGTLIDKSILNLKDVTVIGLSLNCVTCVFWYISGQVNARFYMVVVLALAMAQSLYYVVIPTAPLRLFGPNHMSTNYALIASCTFFASILSPVINTQLLHTDGWEWVFTSGGIFSMFVLCYVILTKFNVQE
ncbi:oxalate:formate antiporter-like isoform x1 [Plakobranchus ocellatus]|uniref:Oxalate:formate antiporter-like isoform x1 n=1 Tax=Plakobranchus ocellatus TaxID=259542 RepID=A0AAV4CYF6_9GAST|nr:oxalate:formate antiporter-like isoform x1 [Plakobranchus ocellatus]